MVQINLIIMSGTCFFSWAKLYLSQQRIFSVDTLFNLRGGGSPLGEAFINSQGSACKEIFAPPADEADRDFWPRLLRYRQNKCRKETMKSQKFRQYAVHCFEIRRCNRTTSATDRPENEASGCVWVIGRQPELEKWICYVKFRVSSKLASGRSVWETSAEWPPRGVKKISECVMRTG